MVRFALTVAMLLPLYSFSAQGASTSCDSICVGSKVINSNDMIGVVIGIQGTEATYQIPGYSPTTSSLSDLSPEVAQYKGLSAGQVVINSNDFIATLNSVFANGKAQYTIAGYNPTVSHCDELSPKVKTLSSRPEIFAGINVINDNDYIGQVNKVFANGKVQYTIPGYNPTISPVSNLSAETPSLGNFAIGSTVINSNDYIGKINKLFLNTKIQYTIAGYNPSISRAADLSIEVESIGPLVAGKLIINSNDYIGTVLLLFLNGRVQYSIPGYNPSIGAANDLSPVVASIPGNEDIVEQTTVINENDYIGVVRHVFANGQTQYQIPGYNPSVSAITTLSPEVATHRSYQKNGLYADDSYQVGKALRFFKNGKIDLKQTQGGHFVAQTLYSEIDRIGNYARGTSIITPEVENATVTSVFTNGAAEYTFERKALNANEKPNTPNTKISSGKIIGFEPKQLQGDYEAWITRLAMKLRGDGYFYPSLSGPNVLVDSSQYLALKQALLRTLTEKPEIIQDPALRTKVITALGT